MRDPYPQFEPLAFDQGDEDDHRGRSLVAGLAIAGVLLILLGVLLACQ